MQNDTRIAVDLAKSVFQLAISDHPGRVSRRARLRRPQFLAFLAQQPPALVLMEACGSAHFWARRIEQLGHTVRLLPPHQVHPYVHRNKTDRTDTDAMLEAGRNEAIHPVPIKTVPQQLLTSLHRMRSAWIAERTARLNMIRGLLREFGLFIPIGAHQVVPAVWALLEDADSDLPDALRPLFAEACHEVRDIEARIKAVERQLEALAQQIPLVSHLLTIPGVGLLTATALFAFYRRHSPLPLATSPRQLARADSSGVLKRSQASPRPHLPSAATDTSAPFSSTVPAPSSSTLAPLNPITSAAGLTDSLNSSPTTRPLSPLRTRSLASSGQSGAASKTTGSPAERPEPSHAQQRRA